MSTAVAFAHVHLNTASLKYATAKGCACSSLKGVPLHCIIFRTATEETVHYISSRDLSAEELLHHARMEWTDESMHWLLDVHFEEDWCRIEDRTVQQNLNIARKAVLNIVKLFIDRTETKRAISKIMMDCLLDTNSILRVVGENYVNL